MISHTTQRFRKLYSSLPDRIRRQARETYKQFQKDPYHPGLQFKRIHSTRPIYSARISRDYRAIGTLDGNEIVWFWIGSHSQYDKIVNQIRHK